MANEPKMKIGIGADTGDFDKGAKKVKQEMKDLSKVSSDAFGAIGAAVGADTGKLMQMGSALNGLGAKFQQSGNAGVAAFGSILKAIDPVTVAIAGLGIGALVSGFKELKSAAEEYNNTVEGSIQKTASLAYIDTFNTYVRQATGAGKKLADIERQWSEFKGTFWSDMGLAVSTGRLWETFDIFNLFTDGSGTKEYARIKGTAEFVGEQGRELTRQIEELELKRKENAIEIAKIDAAIADRMAIVRDTSEDSFRRYEKLDEVYRLINQKRNLSVTLEDKLTDLYKRRHKLVEDSVPAYEAYLSQSQRAFQVSRDIQVEENSLTKVKNSIFKAAEKEEEEEKKISAEYAKQNAELRKQKEYIDSIRNAEKIIPAVEKETTLPDINQPIEIPVKPILPKGSLAEMKELFDVEFGDLSIRVGIEADFEKWEQAAKNVADGIKKALTSLIVETAEAVGELAANLINGENGWKTFGEAALEAFANLASTVGKIAIEAGTTVIALKMALDGMSIPAAYIAIAAGAALVALGAAVKAGLSNAASGSYSASTGVASSSASSALSDYEQRDVYVNVQGTLVADGDQLVAVLNNTDRKNQFTT